MSKKLEILKKSLVKKELNKITNVKNLYKIIHNLAKHVLALVFITIYKF